MAIAARAARRRSLTAAAVTFEHRIISGGVGVLAQFLQEALRPFSRVGKSHRLKPFTEQGGTRGPVWRGVSEYWGPQTELPSVLRTLVSIETLRSNPRPGGGEEMP